MPKVSIITASYNSEEFIERTYASLMAQGHEDWEWLITDDCSVDSTYQLLVAIEKSDSRVIVEKNSANFGAAVSRNRSLDRVSGDFIAFLDSDDIWLPQKLELQLSYMASGVDFSFTAYELIDEQGLKIGKEVDADKTGSFNYRDMLCKRATLGCSTVMLRTRFVRGMRMPLIRTGQDYAFWLSLLKRGGEAGLLNKVLTQYRIVPESISRNKLKKSIRQWQIYREIEGLSLGYSLWCFVNYAWRAIFR